MPGINSPKQSRKKTQFRLALQAGCLETVMSYLGEIDCNEHIDQQTPLSIAIQNEHAELVGVLLNAGAQCNLADEDGTTPLMIAIRLSNKYLVKRLLHAGADSNSLSSRGVTSLYEAADNFDISIVKALLKKGAKLQGREGKKIPEEIVDTLFKVISRYSSITHLQYVPNQLELLHKGKINALLSRNMYLDNLLSKATKMSQPIFDELEEMSEVHVAKSNYQPSIFSLNTYLSSITKVIKELQKIKLEMQHCYPDAEQLGSISPLITRLELLLGMVGAKLVEAVRIPLNTPFNFFTSVEQPPAESTPIHLGFNALQN